MNEVFDPKTLSDDDLFTTQVNLTKRRLQALRLHRHDAAVQIGVMLQAIEMERRERMYMDRVSKLPDSPVILESDPEFQQKLDRTAAEAIDKKAQPTRPLRRAIRTDKPVLPPNGA